MGGREECLVDQIRLISVEICWVQAIECQPWSGSNSKETNSEKAKAASEGKGRIRGFGGRKKEKCLFKAQAGKRADGD